MVTSASLGDLIASLSRQPSTKRRLLSEVEVTYLSPKT